MFFVQKRTQKSRLEFELGMTISILTQISTTLRTSHHLFCSILYLILPPESHFKLLFSLTKIFLVRLLEFVEVIQLTIFRFVH